MPTKRTRATRSRGGPSDELQDFEEFDLTYGALGRDFLSFKTEEEARDAWEIHGEAVVERIAAKRPGTRPWAWWEWEATEPRRELAALRPDCYLNDQTRKRPSQIFIPNPDQTGLVPWLEDEAAYLERLGLWIPGERDAFLAAGGQI